MGFKFLIHREEKVEWETRFYQWLLTCSLLELLKILDMMVQVCLCILLQLPPWHNHSETLHIFLARMYLRFFFLLIFFCFTFFFWLCWIFVAVWVFNSCGAWASHCSGFSLLSTGSRTCGLCSCSSRALEHRSMVVAHELSCSTVCGVFPDQGSNPGLLHWQVFFTNEPPGSL